LLDRKKPAQPYASKAGQFLKREIRASKFHSSLPLRTKHIEAQEWKKARSAYARGQSLGESVKEGSQFQNNGNYEAALEIK
jgi:hypothetical protein